MIEKIPYRLLKEMGLHVRTIYPDLDCEDITERLLNKFWPDGIEPISERRVPDNSLWDERDNYVITYGNSIINGKNKPLDLLSDFLKKHLEGIVSGVHILPYFPYTSDDGFAITDYYSVDGLLGDWEDIGRISTQFRLMSDLVINHCSSQSIFFNEYLLGHAPYDKYFFEAFPTDDLSSVVRPRAHELLRQVDTANGPKHVWCTFSHDQIDFDFSNPDVLIEFVRILRAHMTQGVRTLRLDAIAFLWKEAGTSSIHLQQTHEVVRLMRTLSDYNQDSLILITETNVPNFENLSYFGNRNEAHVVYNFSLPPLLVHALQFGTSAHLNAWQMSMPPAQMGCTYFNFTASHDGIGVRPAEGLLSDIEIGDMINVCKSFGGLVSLRQMPDGSQRPYEINIALVDALKGTKNGEDQYQTQRFLCSQIIAMGLEGIPGIYIHSFIATPNDYDGVEKAQHNRAINRRRWHYPDLLAHLNETEDTQALVLSEMKRILKLRIDQAAFHPNATQFTLQLGEKLFGFWRQSIDRSQSIFAIHNLTRETISIPAASLNLIGAESWCDLLSGDAIITPDSKLDITGIQVVFAPYQCRWITNKVRPNDSI